MKYFILACLGLLYLFPWHAYAQEDWQDKLADAGNQGEVYFSFVASENQVNNLPRWISVDRFGEDGKTYAYAREEKLIAWLSSEQLQEVNLLDHPGIRANPRMLSEISIESIDSWDFYPTYEAYIDMMYQFQENFPDLCRIENIGQSLEGREILVAIISDNVNSTEGEAQFLYTSSMHGDETAGYVLFLRLIDFLLNNYNSDEQVNNLVDNLEIWINPLANPDGTYAGGNNSVYGATRFNANGIDINRNFPDPEDGDHPDGNDWQPETQVFMALASSNNFVMSANCHGGNEVFNYPWDTWSKLHPDDNWWYLVGREWADTVHANSPLGYFDGFDNGVTNGYQWYSISGGRQDYMNYFHHCREFTLEISNVKLLPESQLNDFWTYNHRSFLNYMKQCLYGVRGNIAEAGTNNPLKASVVAENHDMDESWIVSNDQGFYSRPLYAGTYNLYYFSPGYELLKIADVVVNNFAETQLDAVLTPTGAGNVESKFADLFRLSGNPGEGLYRVAYTGNKQLPVVYHIINLQGQRVTAPQRIDLSPGNKLEVDLHEQQAGIYILQLSWDEGYGQLKLLKR